MTGLVGAGLGALGLGGASMFSALEFIAGIVQFFSCDEPKECVKYTEISQNRSALPGGDAVPTPSNPETNSPAGTGENGSDASSANITKSTSDLNVGESNAETQSAASAERKLVRDSLQLY